MFIVYFTLMYFAQKYIRIIVRIYADKARGQGLDSFHYVDLFDNIWTNLSLFRCALYERADLISLCSSSKKKSELQLSDTKRFVQRKRSNWSAHRNRVRDVGEEGPARRSNRSTSTVCTDFAQMDIRLINRIYTRINHRPIGLSTVWTSHVLNVHVSLYA